jgi:hypothetical protein
VQRYLFFLIRLPVLTLFITNYSLADVEGRLYALSVKLSYFRPLSTIMSENMTIFAQIFLIRAIYEANRSGRYRRPFHDAYDAI